MGPAVEFLSIPPLRIHSGFLSILLGQNLDRVTLVFLLGLAISSVPALPPVSAPPQPLSHALSQNTVTTITRLGRVLTFCRQPLLRETL